VRSPATAPFVAQVFWTTDVIRTASEAMVMTKTRADIYLPWAAIFKLISGISGFSKWQRVVGLSREQRRTGARRR
jgi:hypothetical protein